MLRLRYRGLDDDVVAIGQQRLVVIGERLASGAEIIELGAERFGVRRDFSFFNRFPYPLESSARTAGRCRNTSRSSAGVCSAM